jgi:C4-dicarboxylate transporter, DctM subunit
MIDPPQIIRLRVQRTAVIQSTIPREMWPGFKEPVVNAVMTALASQGVAAVFAWLLTSQQVPFKVTQALAAISDNPLFFLLLVNIVYLVVGCVFEVTAALIMTVPVLLPVAQSYGIDPVHLGVVITANMGIGLVTPPVGICLYVACGISGAPMAAVTRPLLPLLAVMIAILLVITYVPDITLFLPRLLLGYGV